MSSSLPVVTRVTGGCHCGTVRFALSVPGDTTPALRACGCSFCRKHGARSVSHPGGRARIMTEEERPPRRYRFAQRTADFLVCARCGVYVGALLEDRFVTLNANALDEPPAEAPPLVHYGDETAEARIARRRARWTPADVVTVHEERADGEAGRALVGAYLRELASVLGGFDPARSVSAEPDDMSAPAGAFLVFRRDGAPIACGGLKTHAPGAGEIKRMYIAPSERGRGLGRDLLDALEMRARVLGFRRVVLDTAAPLEAAARLYRSAGYAEVPVFNDNPYAALWFEKVLAP